MAEIRSSLLTLLCVSLFLSHVVGSSHKLHRHQNRIQKPRYPLENRIHVPRYHLEKNDDDDDDFLSNEVEEDEQRLALQNSERMAEAGTCELPKLQVVHVSDHYPGRYYLPHCTLLHRCGKHAGCCGTDRLKCVAEKKEKVTLHFYSVRIFGHGIPAERKIEKLTFNNHTRCGCAPVEDYNRNDL